MLNFIVPDVALVEKSERCFWMPYPSLDDRVWYPQEQASKPHKDVQKESLLIYLFSQIPICETLPVTGSLSWHAFLPICAVAMDTQVKLMFAET